MRITLKYRILPTSRQRSVLQRHLDCCRWVYNKALEVRKAAWIDRRESIDRYNTVNMIPSWRIENEWLRDGHAQAMQEALTRLDLAFRAFFRRVKDGEDEPGYPRFKGKGRYDSFTYPQEKNNWRFLGNGLLRLSKVGEVKILLHRPLIGNCKTLTIRRDSVGNWYACFSCEVEASPLPVSHSVIGVDLGLTTFAYLSNGKKIDRQRWMKVDARDIARLQRKKDKFADGTAKRRKAIRSLCHAYERSVNRRRNFAHQVSRNLVNEHQFIALEKLDILDMQSKSNKVISNGIADVAWGQFVHFTTYKAESAGRSVALVDPRGTTQVCSGCGSIVRKDLSVRIHDCPHCGLKISRDHNAALNILARGLTSIGAGSPASVKAP